MLLITETNLDSVKMIKEANADGSPEFFIEGIFMQADKENKNGRIYPSKVLMKEAQRYNDEFVKQNRALGELGHPDGPTVNLDKVSHIVKSLWNEGSDVYGKAKLLDTPMGKIAKGLISEGVQVGVSTRGIGSIKQGKGNINEVQDDFCLSAVDIVADPSAPDAFVNGIMEGKEWVWDNGLIKCVDVEKAKRAINKAPNRTIREGIILSAFRSLLEG